MIYNLTTTCEQEAWSSSDEQERLAHILDEYLRELERGAPVAPEDLLARHPELADRLRGYLSGLKLFHQAIAQPPQVPPSADASAQELGDFRLVREIGRGGMGVVYEAEQLSLGRRVALKLLPMTAAIDEKQLARFKNEAQAAAQIDHAHIVPVFAVGQEHGVHYFAMQLIGGRSLSQLLAEMRATPDPAAPGTGAARSALRADHTVDRVRAIAGMIVQAAEAVHAAHEVGVIHRDVKPSNLLLDEKGKVWVTDFGTARCKSSAGLTESGHVLGTLRYMSPEQAQGRAALVDHRTDIYSLGVTLYELAVLRHPFEGVADAALAFEFGRSGWRRPRHFNRAIPVDFENIVLKAMAEGREDRYSAARELADDLQRFLEGKPILARRPSFTSRAGKWAGRHKRSVAAAVGALFLTVFGLAAALTVISAERSAKDEAYRAAAANHRRAEESHADAQAKFREAWEMLDRFGARVAQRLDGVPGAEGVRKELLAEMLPYYQQFARESRDNPEVQADLALTFSKIGYLSSQLGAPAEAEQAYLAAQRILRRLVDADPSRPEHLRSLALCSNNLGQLLQKRGAVEVARTQLERALAIQEQLVGREPRAVEYRADLAATHNNLGLLAGQSGDRLLAAERHQAAIDIQEAIRREDPRRETNLADLAASYNNLASLSMDSQPSTARRWIEMALWLQLSLVREHPRERDYQRDLALSYNNLGVVHARSMQWSEAQICYADAVTIQRRLVSVAPLSLAYRRDLAVTYNNLGMAQNSAGAPAEAKASFTESIQIQKELVAALPRNASLLSGLGGIYNNLGLVHQKQQDFTAACHALEEAIAAQRAASHLSPESHPIREALSKHYYNYADALVELDRPVEAAEATLARRELWPGDDARLQRIADDLNAICQRMPAGAPRSRFLAEAQTTLQMAQAADRETSAEVNSSRDGVVVPTQELPADAPLPAAPTIPCSEICPESIQ